MPTYEYRCPRCGDFEIFQHMSEDKLKQCPECGEKVTKLISKPAVIFNGSGFYTTDYSGKTQSDDKSKKENKSKSKGESA